MAVSSTAPAVPLLGTMKYKVSVTSLDRPGGKLQPSHVATAPGLQKPYQHNIIGNAVNVCMAGLRHL